MLLIRIVIAALLIVTTFGCSQSPQTPSSVVGLWFGEGYQPALSISMVWVVQRKEDGSFIADFRRYQGCELVHRQVEQGLWKQTGQKYFTTTVSINGIPFEADDEYIIEEITSTEMKYLHLNSNTRFEARRISPQAGFPVPANCTI